jgi:hypothetical protein
VSRGGSLAEVFRVVPEDSNVLVAKVEDHANELQARHVAKSRDGILTGP